MTKFESVLRKDLLLFRLLSIALLMMTLTRILFYLTNRTFFHDLIWMDFFAGLWIDMITASLFFAPFYFLFLLPVSFHSQRWYQNGLRILFHLCNGIVIALNLIDVEYFRYTAKRSTSDLFSMIAVGNDAEQMLLPFISDFWWLILLFLMMMIGGVRLYERTSQPIKAKPGLWWVEGLNFLVISAFLLLFIGRGGPVLRPVNALIASKLTIPQNTPLVLNSAFTVIRTIGKTGLKEEDWFPEGSEEIYNPEYHGQGIHQLRENLNVLVIILESFGNEWVGEKEEHSFTPFLDSLFRHSLYFENGFATGKKSIEAVPAIFAGIPALTTDPYITSLYGSNTIRGLPTLLKEKGYSSGFYHGATNGSMNFDLFTRHLGFDFYAGRSEYNNEDHADATWGIMDEYFLPWTARSITADLPEPFLAGLFTLSSHHPFFVPENHKEYLPSGDHPMAQAIAYADMSLRLFFKEAAKQPWYKNTLFILSADHTPPPIHAPYAQRTQSYRIPIAFFDPTAELPVGSNSQIFSQIDIMPSILDLTGYSGTAYTFGNSVFKDSSPFSINFINNSYAYFSGDHMILFTGEKTTGLFNYKKDVFMKRDSTNFYLRLKGHMEKDLKGFVQRYNHDLIYNSMTFQ